MSYLEQILKQNASSRNRRGGLQDMIDGLMREQAPSVGLSPPPVGAPQASSPARGVSHSRGSGVDSWINQALGILKLDGSYASGIKNMIQKESSGNPRAINNWDSNAKKGTPSKGLMQTIDPTFKQWALPGYNKDVYDPISNIIAGVRYAQNRYGDEMLKSGGRKKRNGQYKGY